MKITKFEVKVTRNGITYHCINLVDAVKKALSLKQVFASDIEIKEVYNLERREYE